MKPKFERNNHTIKNLENGKRKPYDSIALAKKKSFKLQKANGDLGMGSLVIVK